MLIFQGQQAILTRKSGVMQLYCPDYSNLIFFSHKQTLEDALASEL